MKIFINGSFLSISPMTGLSRYALAMSRALQRVYGNDVTILIPQYCPVNEEFSDLQITRVGTSKRRLIWEQIDLPIYLRKEGNPLLINWGNTAPVSYSNQVVTILDVFYHHIKDIVGADKSYYPWRDIQFYKLITKIIAKRSKLVLTISEYSKQDIATTLHVNTSKIEVVYPTVSSIFNVGATTDNQNNAKERDYAYILGVSSITPHKNFSSLIYAFRKANLKDTKLVIVGNMPPNSSFNSFIDDRIEFTGYIDDQQLKHLYKGARFFAYPSRFEGFGIPPLEAMACGCPTLVSNVASMPEVCGDASLYVNPFDVDNIANGLIQLNEDKELREQLKNNGYKQLKKYSESISTSRLEAIISQINS